MNTPLPTTRTRVHRRFSGRPARAAAGLLMLCALAALGFGSDATAVRKVRDGIRRFRAGDLETAGKAFAEADVAQPDDLRIAFDRACVYAATGDSDKARELLQQVALSREVTVAVGAHYNLGCLAAGQARAVFGQQPAEATREQRSQGLALLAAAVGHYRDCLRLDEEHAEARHNLEVIRLWIKHMQSVWQERDRQQARQEMNLLQFLAMLESRQSELRSVTRGLIDQPNSPQRRQTLAETQTQQRELTEEIQPLKDKIQAELKPPPQTAGSATPTTAPQPAADDQMAQAIELLSRLADESGQAMRTAADRLDERSLDSAVESQTRVLDNLNQIYMAVAPFTALLKRSIADQQKLVDESESIGEAASGQPSAAVGESSKQQPSAETKSAADPVADASNGGDAANNVKNNNVNNKPAAQQTATQAGPQFDFSEQARRQSRVADWCRMQSLKAEREMPQIEAQVQSLGATPQAPGGQPPAQDPQQALQQLQAVQASMAKAVELAPQAQAAAAEAARQLDSQDIAAALTEQQRALELLKQISEPLPKQDSSDQQNKQDQQDKQNREDQKQDAPQQQDASQQQQQQQQQNASQQLSRQQALSVLRRARERERKHRQAQKQLQRFLSSPVRVDRDW